MSSVESVEVEDPAVLLDARAVGRLRETAGCRAQCTSAAAPARACAPGARRSARPSRSPGGCRVPAGCRPRAPCRPARSVQQAAPVRERAELHLVDDRRDRSPRSCSSSSSLALKFETPIDRAWPSSRARSMPGQAQVGPPCGQWTMYRSTRSIPSRSRLCSASAAGSFCRGWNLVVMNTSSRGDPAVAQPLADAVFVPVRLGRVEVPVAQLERPANRVDALRPIRDLPDAEPEQRDPVAVCELASGAIHGTRR